jgi:hypothetical protein
MRKLLFVLVGALLLQLGLLQTALADTTDSSRTTDPVNTTTAPTTAPTSTTPEPDTGVLSRTPAAGPVGTHITVSSSTPCTPPEDATAPEVEVVLVNPDRPDDDPLTGDVFDVDADGAWQGELVVPTGTQAGRYELDAACYPNDNPDSEPYFIYELKSFTVTAASTPPPPAPPSTQQSSSRPATPVSGSPTFTG